MTVGALYISTELVEPAIRDEFWRSATKPAFETTPVETDQKNTLSGSIKAYPLGSLLVGSTTFSSQNYKRDHRMIAQSSIDHYLVQVVVAGRIVGDFNGRDVAAAPGDVFILDLNQIFVSKVEAGARITAVIMRADLEKVVGARNLHGTVLRGEWPMTRLLVQYLSGLLSVAKDLSSIHVGATQEAMVSLLGAALIGEEQQFFNATPALNVVLRQRVVEFIDQNIRNPALGPDMLIHRFKVSRSHLYRTFEAAGGVATVIAISDWTWPIASSCTTSHAGFRSQQLRKIWAFRM